MRNPFRPTLVTLVCGCLGTFLSSCNERSSHYYGFEQVAEIPINLEGGVLGLVSDLSIDRDGNFYVVDRGNHTVYVLDKAGLLVRQVGMEGRGPGELISPSAISFFEDKLAILDAGNRRVSFFSMDGHYVSSLPLAGSYLSDIEFNGADKMIVSESLGMTNYAFYDLTGKRLSPFRKTPIPPVTLPIITKGGQMALRSNGNILFSPLREYKVLELSWEGDTLSILHAEPPGYIPPDLSSRERFSQQEEWALVLKPIVLGDMVLIQWASRRGLSEASGTSNWQRYVDLYDSKGRLVQPAIPAPALFMFARSDRLYAIPSTESENQNPSIAIYTLKRYIKSKHTE